MWIIEEFYDYYKAVFEWNIKAHVEKKQDKSCQGFKMLSFLEG